MYNRFYPQRGNSRFGGGFVVPFVLGGIAGSLWNNNRPIFFYPVPTPFPYQSQQFFYY